MKFKTMLPNGNIGKKRVKIPFHLNQPTFGRDEVIFFFFFFSFFSLFFLFFLFFFLIFVRSSSPKPHNIEI